MDWQDAVEILVARTRHEAWRRLCSDENADAASRDACRRSVITLAGGIPPALPPIPDNPTPSPGVRLGGCCG